MKNIFSQKKIQPVGFSSEIFQMFELVGNNFKATTVTMFNKVKKNKFVEKN